MQEDISRETEELVNRAFTGDQDAIAALYQLYEKKLRSAVRDRLGRQLRGQMDSADLIQSVWGDVLDDMGQFTYRGPNSFFQWILTRLVHKIQTKGRYYTREKRDLRKVQGIPRDDPYGSKPVDPPRSNRTPSEAAISKERLEKLTTILDRFPEHQRQVLIYRIRDELGYEEISKRLGRSMEATRMLYARSLKKLVDLMLQEPPSQRAAE